VQEEGITVPEDYQPQPRLVANSRGEQSRSDNRNGDQATHLAETPA
jgi:hypothetical protein